MCDKNSFVRILWVMLCLAQLTPFSFGQEDPFFRQREIFTILDLPGEAKFGEYLNNVNVIMKKRHQNGEISHDEILIDASRSQKEYFRLIYGWKNDSSFADWLDYEVKINWSYQGGLNIEQNWQTTNCGLVELLPPYVPKRVQIKADEETLVEAKIRLATVTFFYTIEGKEKVKTISWSQTRGLVNHDISFLLPIGESAYEYQITWRIAGESPRVSKRISTKKQVIRLDRFP